MTTAFLDAGYLIALEAIDDQHHSAAVAHWDGWLRTRPKLMTTTFVIDEVVTWFSARGRHTKAIDIARRMLSSKSVRVVYVDEELFMAGLDYLQRRPDKRYSLTDCISFVAMERAGVHHALAFDAHFRQAGFTLLPTAPR